MKLSLMEPRTTRTGHMITDTLLLTTYHIGQDAYEIPTVFSYFLPGFQPAGPIKKASLVSPEAQLLTGPYVLSLLNGFFSLIKWGMNGCYDGFFQKDSSCTRDPG